ncbi:MAG: hypothetical protein HYV09_02855 [Deltaproteobacteria bacterium]|nr:hypothetical protein [Deltaproteobacteria bacterium]
MGDARLLNPAALDAKKSPRARVSIVVPTAWLREGARLELAVPAKLRCDLCDGGGCDACGRSGAYRAPEEGAKVALTLPRVTDDFLALRVTNPFGDREPTLLVVRLAAGVEPSAGVTWVGPNHDVEPVVPPGMPQLPNIPKWLPWALLVIAAALLGLLTRRC